MPDWVLGLLVQIPLVGAVAYGFLSRRIRTDGEFTDLEARHSAEVTRLVEQRREEREGRIAAERRVADLTERWERALDTLGRIERELIRAAGHRGRPPDAP